jgi:hypothetical protein
MELLSISYISKEGSAKDILLIYLGEYNGKIFGLDAAKIGDEERKFIMQNASQVENMPLKLIAQWVQMFCPNAYKSGFKTLSKSKAKINSRHKVTVGFS